MQEIKICKLDFLRDNSTSSSIICGPKPLFECIIVYWWMFRGARLNYTLHVILTKHLPNGPIYMHLLACLSLRTFVQQVCVCVCPSLTHTPSPPMFVQMVEV